MSKAVVGQSLRITSTTGVDLTGASSVTVWYQTPAGTTGSVTATVTTAATGVIYADIPALSLATAGGWHFMVKATLASGNIVKSFGIGVEVKPEFEEE